MPNHVPPPGESPRPDLFGSSRPPTDIEPLHIDDLEAALDRMMLQIRDTTSISTTIQFDEWIPLTDPRRAEHVYRIVQAAVNAFAGGDHIVLSLATRGLAREVWILDNGPVDEVHRDLERLEPLALEMGGTLATELRVSTGTSVRLTFHE